MVHPHTFLDLFRYLVRIHDGVALIEAQAFADAQDRYGAIDPVGQVRGRAPGSSGGRSIPRMNGGTGGANT